MFTNLNTVIIKSFFLLSTTKSHLQSWLESSNQTEQPIRGNYCIFEIPSIKIPFCLFNRYPLRLFFLLFSFKLQWRYV